MGLFLHIDRSALVCEWVNSPIVWSHPRTNEAEVTPRVETKGKEGTHAKEVRNATVCSTSFNRFP